MKSVLSTILLVVAVSIACSTSRSEGSPATANTGPVNAATTVTSSDNNSGKAACSLSLSEAPVIKGLKLRMTPDEVLAVFPGSKDDAALRATLSQPPSQFGSLSFLIRPSKYESKEKFSEVTQITFAMLDGRISNFSVGYNGPEWPSVDKFVTQFVEGTNLPPADQWEAYAGLENQMKTLKCADFEVRVFAGGEGGNQNYVLMRDLEADKKLKERRDKARAKPTPA